MMILSTYEGLEETVSRIPIQLSKAEQAVARYIGQSRHKTNVQDGVRDQRTMRGMNPEEMHVMAAGAELVACRALNIYPDLSVVAGRVSRPAYDAIWEGRTTDIKHTQHAQGGIAAVAIKTPEKQVDLYVLVTGVMPNYTLVGWCAADELFQPGNLRQDWTVPGYYLPQDKLRPFRVLHV